MSQRDTASWRAPQDQMISAFPFLVIKKDIKKLKWSKINPIYEALPNSCSSHSVCCPYSECMPINIYQMSLPSSFKSVQKPHLFHETYVRFWQLVLEKKQVKVLTNPNCFQLESRKTVLRLALLIQGTSKAHGETQGIQEIDVWCTGWEV